MKLLDRFFVKSLFFLLALPCFGQSFEENFVQETIFSIPTQTGVGLLNTDKIVSISYFDGLGVTKQSIGVRAGGSQEDLISPIKYDNFGRMLKEYLALPVSNNNGEYYPDNLIQNLENYYSVKFYDDFDNPAIPFINPYLEKRYESLTNSYVLEQAAPGHDWSLNPNNDNDHTIKFSKETNAPSEVINFNVSFSGDMKLSPVLSILGDGFYDESELFKNTIKDENWQENQQFAKNHTVEEFKDKFGRVVLKRSYNQTIANVLEPLNTYYVYDHFGNLTYVLPPMLSGQIINTNSNQLVGNYQALLDELGFQYKYDHRNRLIEKKLPGKGWEYIVYTLANKPVLTQDANLRLEDKWLLTKYDVFGRVAYTGIVYSPNQTRESLQITANNTSAYPYQYVRQLVNPVDIAGTQVYYSNDTFPTNSISKILTVQYYDKYIDHQGITIPNWIFGVNRTDQLNGLPTVAKTRVLGTNEWITSISAYDEKGRVIWSQSNNDYLQTENITSFKLKFTGDVIESIRTHSYIDKPTITFRDYFEYDHVQKLKTHKQKIDNEPLQLISEYIHDELGTLVQKNVGGETFLDGYTFLTNVEISVDNIISKTANNSSNNGWNAGLLTKGKIINDGGIKFEVPDSMHRYYKIGLTETTGFTDISGDWDEFDYGIYILAGDDNFGDSRSDIKLIIDGVTTGPVASYVAGDEFSIERVDDQIIFKKGEAIINQVTQLNEYDLTGKVGLYSYNAKVKNVELFGQQIDTKLQEINYVFNVRGWLTNINSISEILDGKASDDLFDFRVNYNETETNTSGIKLFNGNISQTAWRTRHDDLNVRAYEYSYDALSRITKARSLEANMISSLSYNNNHDLDNITYDPNGNIKTLLRRGFDVNGVFSDIWDNLQYSYSGNQLNEIVDANVSSLSNSGFVDGATNSNEYRYDINGNLIADDNKGISLIEYNHLNLPSKVTIPNAGDIEFVYDAFGNKIEKKILSSSSDVTTIYNDGLIYVNNTLSFILHPEGYIEPTIVDGMPTSDSVKKYDKDTKTIVYSAYSYVFQYRDIWGNERLSYSDLDLNGAIDSNTEIRDEKNYYPFGLEQQGYNNIVIGSENNYKAYQGQELHEEFDLNALEFRYRFYYSDIGRFWSMDPIAEKYSYNSTYAFSENKLGMGIELEGLEVLPTDLAVWFVLQASDLKAQFRGGAQKVADANNRKKLSIQQADPNFDPEKARISRIHQTAQGLSEMAEATSDVGHVGLEGIGILDPTGIADAINAGWYAAEGDYLNATLSGISILPYLGDAIGKGGKGLLILGKAHKIGRYANETIGAAHMFKEGFGLGLSGLSESNTIMQAMYKTVDGGGKLLFDLGDVSIDAAKKGFNSYDAAAEAGQITEWELSKVLRDQDLFENAVFHINGAYNSAQDLGLKFIND